MQFIVYLSPEASRGTRADHPPSDLQNVLDALAIQIRPEHPASGNPLLDSSFIGEIPDPLAAREALAQLNNCPGVTAAYLKPAPDLPD